MSESVQLYLPFDQNDINPNADSLNNDSKSQSTIMGLAEKLNYVNPAIYSGYHAIAEADQIAIRHEWMLHAEQYFSNGDYMTCLYWLKQVYEHVEHSLDHTHLTDIDAVQEECYSLLRARGKVAVCSEVEFTQ